MSASPSTKLQVNFKTPGQSLINVYADNDTQLDLELSALQARIGTIIAIEQLIAGGGAVAATLPVAAAVVQPPAQPAAAPVAQPAAAAPAADAGMTCAHGPRQYVTGQGAKGPWKAWMCPTPKGSPDKCDPIWVR